MTAVRPERVTNMLPAIRDLREAMRELNETVKALGDLIEGLTDGRIRLVVKLEEEENKR